MPSFVDYLFDGKRYSLRDRSDDNVIERVDDVSRGKIDSCEPNSGTFNDLPFYLRLLRNPKNIRLSLAGVIVRHNSFVLGIQSVYRCIRMDDEGNVRAHYEEGPFHGFDTGPFSSRDRPEERVFVREFALMPGKEIHRVEFRQGDITDAIVFFTNRWPGIEWLGGHGGDYRSTRLVLSDPSRSGRIVALAGTYKGVVHRIGFCTCHDTQESLVMNRRLCELRRATPVQAPESLLDWALRTMFGYVRQRIQFERAVRALTARASQDGDEEEGVPDDIFKEVLEFLS